MCHNVWNTLHFPTWTYVRHELFFSLGSTNLHAKGAPDLYRFEQKREKLLQLTNQLLLLTLIDCFTPGIMYWPFSHALLLVLFQKVLKQCLAIVYYLVITSKGILQKVTLLSPINNRYVTTHNQPFPVVPVKSPITPPIIFTTQKKKWKTNHLYLLTKYIPLLHQKKLTMYSSQNGDWCVEVKNLAGYF